ncbi:glycoside hydrolase family 25 protein [Alicyclobacillus dauci]|uniref:Glycoside hydrolase family 25 protein n=1 Tax=Alicyclobacillus dauci TaxID=1475485 RepID=A0ABY6Z7U8_9BACL|nr:glycoside hydrolase family 25 protein [Alicyclobacillus dauci]WAH38246.1 glycoside hydrolase family 25 protein [Alicyclobacillus dauci]
MSYKILDISSFQPNVDWAKVKTQIDGVYIKVTEGVTWTDPTLLPHIQGARSVGIPVGVYHFAHPDHNKAEDEAKHFLSVVQPLGQFDFLPALDLEEPTSTGTMTADQIVGWVQEWDTAIQAYCNDDLLYTGRWYINSYDLSALTRHPLWIALYGPNAPVAAPWSNWTMWQKTDQATIDGIQGPVDISDAISLDPLKWGSTMARYPSVTATVDGNPYSAIAVNNQVYLIWTAIRDCGANITKANFNDVEIDGEKPPQVTQDGNTYVVYTALPNLQPYTKNADGSFSFSTKPPVPTPQPPASTGPTSDDIQKALSLLEQAT